MTGNNPKLDLVNMNAHTKFAQIIPICSEDNERKGNSDIIQEPSVTNLRKMMSNNPNLDHVNINAYTKFGKILSICSQEKTKI